MLRLVTRPLLIIFLTIFVNLVGFGIIIPLLPFYAETFGASPLVIGLLFAVFSLCQLVAAPALGDLSDRYGRRPILIFSLAGTVVSFVMLAMAHSIAMLFAARIVDGLSGGNISTARAYVADITEPKDRARAYGLIGAAFGLGFIFGPALSGVLAKDQLHGADLGGGGAHARRDGRWRGCGCRRRSIARRPAPAIRSAICRSCCGARVVRRVLVDRFRLLVRVRDVPDDVRAVRGAAVRLRRAEDRLLLRGVRRARRRRAGRLHPADREAARRQADVSCSGLGFGAVGLVAAALVAFGRDVRARAGAARARHRLRAPDDVEPGQPRRAATSRAACRARRARSRASAARSVRCGATRRCSGSVNRCHTSRPRPAAADAAAHRRRTTVDRPADRAPPIRVYASASAASGRARARVDTKSLRSVPSDGAAAQSLGLDDVSRCVRPSSRDDSC